MRIWIVGLALLSAGAELQLPQDWRPAHGSSQRSPQEERGPTGQIDNVPSGRRGATLQELEREHVLRVLEQTKWRIEGPKGAAVILGVNPSTLRSRIRKYGIQ